MPQAQQSTQHGEGPTNDLFLLPSSRGEDTATVTDHPDPRRGRSDSWYFSLPSTVPCCR